jgi:hypothetical protein
MIFFPSTGSSRFKNCKCKLCAYICLLLLPRFCYSEISVLYKPLCEFLKEGNWCYLKEEEELRVKGPGVNEVSFRARPHHNMHRTLGVWCYLQYYALQEWSGYADHVVNAEALGRV